MIIYYDFHFLFIVWKKRNKTIDINRINRFLFDFIVNDNNIMFFFLLSICGVGCVLVLFIIQCFSYTIHPTNTGLYNRIREWEKILLYNMIDFVTKIRISMQSLLFFFVFIWLFNFIFIMHRVSPCPCLYNSVVSS